jgi:uncharacterized membrane protein
MNFALLSEASPMIFLHLMFALLAIIAGAIQLICKKGTTLHKALGYVWVMAMVVICLSSFGIRTIMPDGFFYGFSPIHLLSIWVLFQLARGVYFARKYEIAHHRKCMVYTYIGGLLIAGAFTLMPGRFLYKVFVTPWL